MRINRKKKECANAPIGPFTMFSHCVYGYNIRNELVCSRRDEMHRRSSASEGRFGVAEPEGCASICEGAEVLEYQYQYDDIGDVNSLTPNSSTSSLISMSYDRMGRRVTKNAQRFVYDGYLCIGKIEDSTSIALRKEGRDASSCSVKVFCNCCKGIRHLHTGGYYEAPKEKESSGKIVICKNVLSNMNLKYDYDYEKKAKEVLNHEMLHAVQECYPEKFKTPCEESICQEINAYYNANTGDTSIYRCEKERKEAVLDGVLYSSSFVCYPGTAPKITEKQKQRLEQDFKRLYERCKNKWPKKRQFDRRK